ncbi:MAG: outer membrane protein assembly factor BamB family protein [Pirellulales bacterium]
MSQANPSRVLRQRIRAGSIALACLMLLPCAARAGDWPQWGGQDGRNMVAAETGFPDSFVPGQKDAQGSGINLSTTRNVKWVAQLGTMACSTPAIAQGKIFLGIARNDQGVFQCLEESTGRLLWEWIAPARDVPKVIDGNKFWFSVFPARLGVCSSPAVDGDRVYFVSQRCEVLCLGVAGRPASASPAAGKSGPGQSGLAPDVVWEFDMWDMGVRPSDACNCSVLVHGDFVYVCTSNGTDRDAEAYAKGELRKPPAPLAPSLIVLDKKTGRLVAEDDEHLAPRCLHGQWSSPSLGRVGDKTLVFFGAGDGACYAFEALTAMPEKPVKLKKVWWCDCIPAEYKVFGKWNAITHYCLGDKRRSDTINPNDPAFVGTSEIIATPVFHENRVYVAIGRDPEHGRGRGALWCLDATKTGDITAAGKIWCYQGLDRTLSTVSVAGGLVYAADVAGRLHCLDAETGKVYWIHEAKATVWGSTLVADGKVYLPTQKNLWILTAGKESKILDKINLGSAVWATPVVANGAIYIASQRYLWAVGK